MNGVVDAVNVGVPRPVELQGRTIWTAIWKHPVEGRVPLRASTCAATTRPTAPCTAGRTRPSMPTGPRTPNGGRQQLGRPLGPGAFGENLTVRGLPVSEAVIGERWAVGSTLLEVAQPRLPCFKLGIRMGDPRFLKRFAAAARPGAYFRVIREGDIGAGDTIEVVARPEHGVTSALVSRAILGEPDLLAAAHEATELPVELREWMAERAEALAARSH